MTNALAREVFEVLTAQIENNGLTDIFTFSLPQVSGDNQYSSFKNDYTYQSTETAVQGLKNIAETFGEEGGLIALNRLLDACRQYFLIAQSIPEKYSAITANLFRQADEPGPTNIVLSLDNG